MTNGACLSLVYSYKSGPNKQQMAYYSKGMCANSAATCTGEKSNAQTNTGFADWRCLTVGGALMSCYSSC